MQNSGNYNLDKNDNYVKRSSIVVNHEQLRLNTNIKKLENEVYLCKNEILISNEEKESLNRQLIMLGNRHTKLIEEAKLLTSINNRENTLTNRCKLDLDNATSNLDKYKEEIKQLKIDKKDLFDEKAELIDSKKIILKSNIINKLKIKKEILLPLNIDNFKKNITNILNQLNNKYSNWLDIFINNWKGDSSNIFSLSGNRNIEILKKFGYIENFQTNGIPTKVIEEPNNGWRVCNQESLNYLVKDYNCFSNILLKSCPGCDDFVIDKKIDISLKTLFNAVSMCIPDNTQNKDNQMVLINSSYADIKYWSNCKENIDKSIVCSKNIVYLNKKLNDMNDLNDTISCLFDNINELLLDYLVIENDYAKMNKIWNDFLKKIKKIYNLISNEFFEINNNNFRDDNVFVQVDNVILMNEKDIIQWIRQVPLVYSDPITGPLVFNPTNKLNEYNPTKYLIASKDGHLNSIVEKTYQLAGEEGNIFEMINTGTFSLTQEEIKYIQNMICKCDCDNVLKLFNKLFPDKNTTHTTLIDKQDNKVPINKRWEVIKTADELRNNIINNREQYDISKINLYFQDIINNYTKFTSLFNGELEYLNL